MRIGAQSTLGGRHSCLKNMYEKNARILHDSCPKNYQNTLIFMILARKNEQNSRILHDFCPKMPEFFIIIARKIFSRILVGAPPPFPPSPTPMDITHDSKLRHNIVIM